MSVLKNLSIDLNDLTDREVSDMVEECVTRLGGVSTVQYAAADGPFDIVDEEATTSMHEAYGNRYIMDNGWPSKVYSFEAFLMLGQSKEVTGLDD